MEKNEIISSEQKTEINLENSNEHWTKEVMLRAKPIATEIANEQTISLLARKPWTLEGTPTIMESLPPDNRNVESYKITENIQEKFKTNLVSNKSILPFATVGKIFMTFNDQDYVGTAWVIAEQAVFTAAHCIFSPNDGGWADNVLFVPQYNGFAESPNISEPLGRWIGGKMWSFKGWVMNRDFEYDMGVVLVDRPIRPSTGTLGWMANFPPNQGPYHSLGYPADEFNDFDFSGNNMWECIGDYISGSNPVQMHNNMTQGCSGGPWVISRNSKPYANGLNSFRYNNLPETMYSPYFGNNFISLYNKVKDAGVQFAE